MSSDDTLSLNDHELLLQLTAMFREFDARQREFDTRQREFDARQREFDTLLHQHDARLVNVEGTIASRLYDTRPIWEAVQSQINELRADVEKGFRKSDRKITLFYEQVAELYAYQRDIEERVEKLEPKA